MIRITLVCYYEDGQDTEGNVEGPMVLFVDLDIYTDTPGKAKDRAAQIATLIGTIGDGLASRDIVDVYIDKVKWTQLRR